MNDSMFSSEPSSAPSPMDDELQGEEIPQFGAVDIVEAFTAMRHEWRGQTKESRALAEQIQEAVAHLHSLEEKRLSAVADQRFQAEPEARQLALLIAEVDHHLTRAVEAVAQSLAKERQREAAAEAAVETQIAAMSSVARWFSRPLLTLLAGQASVRQREAGEHPAVAGLNMVLARLRRAMREQGIERLEVLGEPFDADTMHAIGTAASSKYPPGCVAEQLSPAYRWQGQLLRFADVRVAEQRHKTNCEQTAQD